MGPRTFLLCGVLFVVVTAGAASAEGPRLTLAETRFDFGKVVDGSPAVHVFEIRNAGDAVLSITKVQPT